MTSTFRHDSQGFLVGELLDVNRELLDAQSAGMSVWRGIRSDVKAIAKVLGAQVRKSQAQQHGTPSSQPRASGGQFTRKVATPAGRAGAAMARSGSPAGPGRATAGTTTITTRATVSPVGRNNRGQFMGASKPNDIETRPISGQAMPSASQPARRETLTTALQPAGRDGRGRFAQGNGDSPDKAGRDGSGKLTNAIEKLSGSLGGAEQLDPTIAAVKEVKDAVSPLGRGMFTMFGRGAERKKEVWYKRFLKALTGKKDSGGGRGMGGRDAVQSGSFAGTFMGELLSKATAFVAPLLMGLGTALIAGLGLLGAAALGTYVGGKIYEWLDKSGIAAKIFDAFDAVKDWFKEKYQQVTGTVKTVVNDFQKGAKEQADPVKFAPAVLGQSGRNVNDPRRIDRAEAVTPDGRMINDPRRIDAAPLAELPPATSMAQRAGRFVGGIKQLLKSGSGNVIDERKAALTRQMDAVGITDPVERAAFMAQADHESGGFKDMQELGGRNYFKKYDGRKDLGNTQPGDGEKFKGRGFLQLTGRSNYRDMGKKLGIDLENNPERATDPEIAAKIATQFWNDRSRAKKFGGGKISELARAGNIDGVTQGINGGMNGAQGRRDLFASYLKSGETISAGAARIPPMSIPSSTPERIAPAPEAAIPARLNTDKQPPVKVSMREPIGQDVGDRSIAHVVSGGLGMMA